MNPWGRWSLVNFFIIIIKIEIAFAFCRPVSGGSMNPARSIGPAIVIHVYKGLWVYVVGPIIGAIAGAFAYNFLRSTGTPFTELTTGQSVSE